MVGCLWALRGKSLGRAAPEGCDQSGSPVVCLKAYPDTNHDERIATIRITTIRITTIRITTIRITTLAGKRGGAFLRVVRLEWKCAGSEVICRSSRERRG